MTEELLQFDTNLLLAINAMHAPWLDTSMMFLTSKYSWIPVYFLVAYLVYQKDGWKNLVLLGIAAAVSILMADQLSSSLVKPWVARPRPCQDPLVLGLLNLPKGCSNGFSFVSSHAANFGALAMLVSCYGKNRSVWWRILPWICAVLVSYTRVYLGVHYPSDVLAGMMLGAACGALCFAGFKVASRRFQAKRS